MRLAKFNNFTAESDAQRSVKSESEKTGSDPHHWLLGPQQDLLGWTNPKKLGRWEKKLGCKPLPPVTTPLPDNSIMCNGIAAILFCNTVGLVSVLFQKSSKKQATFLRLCNFLGSKISKVTDIFSGLPINFELWGLTIGHLAIVIKFFINHKSFIFV